jgi:hypothetical protein
LLTGDELHQKIRTWLSPPDPWKNHNIACETYYKQIATWFIEGDAFTEWKSSGSLLWIRGNRVSFIALLHFYIDPDGSNLAAGAGKTILRYAVRSILPIAATHVLSKVLQSSRTSIACASLGWRLWLSSIVISETTKRRIAESCSPLLLSNFVINPTPTMRFYLVSILNMIVAHKTPAIMHLHDVWLTFSNALDKPQSTSL